MKINEICKPTILPDGAEACVVPMKKMSAADWKKEEEQWKQADIEDEKFYRMKGHAERNARRNLPVKEGSGIYYDPQGNPYFNRIEDYKRALKSDTGFIRKAAQDVMARGGQEGWPKQDQQVAQLTMPTDSQQQKTILDPNRAGLNIADISKPLSQPPVADPKIPIPAVPFKSSIKPIKYSPAIRSRRQ